MHSMKTIKAIFLSISAAAAAALAIASQTSCVVYNDECTRFVEDPDGIAFYLDGSVNISRNEVRVRDNPVGEAVADAYYNAFNNGDQRASAAIVNGGAIREDGQCESIAVLKAGVIKRKTLRDILPFDNRLTLSRVTYASLKQILEHGIAGHSVVDSKGSYLQVAGLKVTVDCSRQGEEMNEGKIITEGDRVTSIRIRIPDCTASNEDACYGPNILPLSPQSSGTIIYLAAEDFISGGGDYFRPDWFGDDKTVATNYAFEIVAKYLASTFTKDSPMHHIPEERVTLQNCEAVNLTE